MKKKGFTLAEFLVALGIVGVIAAVTIPAVNRILPDKDKGTVLKIYKTIGEINQEIFNNPSLYIYTDLNCYIGGRSGILQCFSAPLDGNHPTAVGVNKYPKLLMEYLTLADDSVTVNNGACAFNTADGIYWNITVDLVPPAGDIAIAIEQYNIEINIDTSNTMRNCTYNNVSCKNPAKFKFIVNKKGEVKAADDDYLTQAFLENPGELNNRSADLRRAAELSASASSSSASSSSSSQ